MRWDFVRQEPGRIEFGIIYGTIALLLLLGARFFPLQSFAPACSFKSLTGLPCPTCGATRSVMHLAQGDVLSSLALNPLAFGVLFFAVLALLYGTVAVLLDLPRLSVSFSDAETGAVRAMCILTLIANWVYLLVSV